MSEEYKTLQTINDADREKIIEIAHSVANTLHECFVKFVNEQGSAADSDFILMNGITNGVTKFYASVIVKTLDFMPVDVSMSQKLITDNLLREINLMLEKKGVN